MSKEQRTEGFKTDELFHKAIILKYNNKEKHNKRVHDLANCKGGPSNLVPITWQHSKQTLSTVLREYEKCFNNWKQLSEWAFKKSIKNSSNKQKPFNRSLLKKKRGDRFN